MKKLSLGNPLPGEQGFETWATKSLRLIEQASAEDIQQAAAGYSIGTFTETRTLNPATATATDVANFLATFVSDIQKGGQKRSYAS